MWRFSRAGKLGGRGWTELAKETTEKQVEVYCGNSFRLVAPSFHSRLVPTTATLTAGWLKRTSTMPERRPRLTRRRTAEAAHHKLRVRAAPAIRRPRSGLHSYGFLSKHSSLSIDYGRMLVCFYLGWCYVLARTAVSEERPKRPMVCSECRGELHLVMITDHIGRVPCEHLPPYLDSG